MPSPAATVFEAPTDAAYAILNATTSVVIVDCLTMLAANALESRCVIDGDSVEALVLERVKALLGAARKSSGSLIVVTNEVGSSIHPPTNLGRWFQDGLGRANQAVAREADAVHLLVCGVPVAIKGSLA